jgi:hypothetical protein
VGWRAFGVEISLLATLEKRSSFSSFSYLFLLNSSGSLPLDARAACHDIGHRSPACSSCPHSSFTKWVSFSALRNVNELISKDCMLANEENASSGRWLSSMYFTPSRQVASSPISGAGNQFATWLGSGGPPASHSHIGTTSMIRQQRTRNSART